jgi:hypothetical protein
VRITRVDGPSPGVKGHLTGLAEPYHLRVR